MLNKNATQEQKANLIYLYQQLYELTNPLCKKCSVPQSCCSAEYCDMAKFMMEEWGVEIKSPNEHPKLPFMSKTGCVVTPYLRPLCTRHHCNINSLGFFSPKFTDDADDKTDKYFELIEKIDLIELEIYE